MSHQPKISTIIDDSGWFDYDYEAGRWDAWRNTRKDEAGIYYLETYHYPTPSENSPSSFTMYFNGTSIAFVGDTTLDVAVPQVAVVQIDNGPSEEIFFPHSTYTTWYQSHTLSDGNHTINVSVMGATVDFALVDVGLNTWIGGKTIIIDNDDEFIQYSGNWRRSEANLKPHTKDQNDLTHRPVKGSSHRSSSVGDALSFSFTGTHVEVYGIFNWALNGTLRISFSLDGQAPEVRIFESLPTSPYFYLGYQETGNFQYYSREVRDGNHTMLITILECNRQEFIFDYATYYPGALKLPAFPTPVPFPTPAPVSDRGGSFEPTRLALETAHQGLVLIFGFIFLVYWLLSRKDNKKPAYRKQIDNLSTTSQDKMLEI